MANVPITGLSALGNVLADFGQQYRRDARQDQLLLAQQQAQLDAEGRAVALEDARFNRGQAAEDARYERDRAGRQMDVDEARRREDEVYAKRRGEALEDVESNRLWSLVAKDLERAAILAERAPFEKNLQLFVNDAAKQLTGIQAHIASVLELANAPEAVINPGDRAVQELAQQLAGGSKKKEDIALMVPKALEQLQGQAFLRHRENAQRASQALQALRAREIQLTDILQTGVQAKVAPTVAPPTNPVTGSLTQPGKPLGGVTTADLAAEIAKARGKPLTPPPSVGGGASLFLDNPTNEPLIEAENQRRRQAQGTDARRAIEDPYNAAVQQLAAVRRNIEGVRSGNPQAMAASSNPAGGWLPGSVPNPGQQAQVLSNLLREEAELAKRTRDLQAQLQGPGANVGVAGVNTQTSFTPAVFDAQTFAAPGTMAPNWFKVNP